MIVEDTILNAFKLPIEYTKFKYLNENVITDLELDTSNNAYDILFNNSGTLGNIIKKKWKHYYSSDVSFLKQQQGFIKSIYKKNKKYKKKGNNDDNNNDITDTITQINAYYKKWRSLKNDSEDTFLKKYQFNEWEHIKFLNKQPMFLQAMTLYNITSPLIHILLPVILLIIPFFLIKLVMKIPFSFNTYKSLLAKSFQSHAFGKIFTAFCSPNCDVIDMNTKIYAAVSFALYIFTLYQNILGCVKFYTSSQFIKQFLYDTNIFISNCNKVNSFISNNISKKDRLMNKFLKACQEELLQLNEFGENIKNVDSSSLSFKNITSMGNFMYNFHNIFSCSNLEETFCYWFGCCGFLENINGIIERKEKNIINFAKFTQSKTNTKMSDLFYIYHLDNDVVKNTVTFDKNIIISGPNASGKTTLLKSILINILFSQQFGLGCYNKYKFKPYDYLDSYINIPDTSARDSLFQAEARRCLNIINIIKERPNYRVFCIFDELFSGTNPHEAQKSALAYLKYLHKYNITYLLTTHFNDLKEIQHNRCRQACMNVINTNNEYKYTYLLREGKSNIYGGFKVLKDLKYPNEIIDSL